MPRAVVFALVCAAFLSISSFAVADDPKDFITVNGVSVSQDAFYGRLEDVRVQAATKDGQKVSMPAGQYIVQQLISEMLLTQLAEKAQVVPTSDQIDAKIEYARRSSGGNFDAQLKLQGISSEEYRKQTALRQTMINLITKDIKVSDTEAKADYDLQMKEASCPFKKPEAYNFSVVTCRDKTRIDEAYKQLESGKEFASVAKEISEDQSTAPDGGKVGWLSADMTAIPEIIRITTFATLIGKYSKPVFLQDKQEKAWVIIKVDEKRVAEVQSFDQVKDIVKEQIAVKKADRKAFDKLLRDFVASSKIEVSADRFKDIATKVKTDAAIDASLAQPAVAPAVAK